MGKGKGMARGGGFQMPGGGSGGLGGMMQQVQKLQEEMQRARAITVVASKIIENGSLVLEARKLMEDHLNDDKPIPRMLEG